MNNNGKFVVCPHLSTFKRYANSMEFMPCDEFMPCHFPEFRRSVTELNADLLKEMLAVKAERIAMSFEDKRSLCCHGVFNFWSHCNKFGIPFDSVWKFGSLWYDCPRPERLPFSCTPVFHDLETASKYQKLLNPRTRKHIDQILTQVVAQQPTKGTTPPTVTKKELVGEDGRPCNGLGDAGADVCMRSCGPDPPDCALLHDKLSLPMKRPRESWPSPPRCTRRQVQQWRKNNRAPQIVPFVTFKRELQ